MPVKHNKLPFQASAYLQTLIGKQLFRSQDFALLELVKNSYDSGASVVSISIQPRTAKQPGQIVVADDGHGMNERDFGRLFMVAGYSERPAQIAGSRRTPTGEKGIGRFATDRLGSLLEVTTKTLEDASPLVASIDWSKFQDRRKKFHEVSLSWRRDATATVGKTPSGTILEIDDVREDWNDAQVRSLRETLGKLLNPLDPPSKFRIELTVTGHPNASGPIVPQRPTGADIELSFKIIADGTVERRLTTPQSRTPRPNVARSNVPSTKPLVGLSGHLFYFTARPTKALVGGLDAGVRLYRDGFKIEPFGTESADWLGVSAKRAKRAGHAHIVPSRLFGFVAISRKKHDALQDTTGREALLDNEAVRSLVTVLREQIAFLEDNVRTTISEPRWKRKRAERATHLERERLHSLSIVADGLAHELRQPLQAIRSEADNIRTRLSQLDIDDADIAAAQASIDENVERIDSDIRFVSQLSSGNPTDAEELNLAEVVRTECGFLLTRCVALGIGLTVQTPEAQRATVNRTAVQMILMNLIRNAIDALSEVTDDRLRTISVELRMVGGRHRLTVTDNGTGVAADIRPKIFKRFASKKTGGSGVGLYNCRVIARAWEGDLTFESREGVGSTFTLELPNEA